MGLKLLNALMNWSRIYVQTTSYEHILHNALPATISALFILISPHAVKTCMNKKNFTAFQKIGKNELQIIKPKAHSYWHFI